MQYTVFGVSGGEAVDLAFKVARAYTEEGEFMTLTFLAALDAGQDGDTITITGTIEPGADLYVSVASQQEFACKDTDIVSPPMDRDGTVWSDDCGEMFILPELRLGTYWEIVIGPTGTLFDALHALFFQPHRSASCRKPRP